MLLILILFLVNLQDVESASTKCGLLVDLRKEFGPIRDQGEMGWCYGYVATDLVTHRYIKVQKLDPKRKIENFFSARASSMEHFLNTSKEKGTSLTDIFQVNTDQFNLKSSIRQGEALKERWKNELQKLAGARGVDKDLPYYKNVLKLTQSDLSQYGPKKELLDREAWLKKVVNIKETIDNIRQQSLMLDKALLKLREKEEELISNVISESNILNGGSAYKSIELILKNGMCSESEIPSSGLILPAITNDQMKFLRSRGEITAKLILGKIYEYYAMKDDGALCEAGLMGNLLFPRFPLKDIMAAITKGNEVDPFFAILKKCQRFNFNNPSKVVPDYYPKKDYSPGDSATLNTMFSKIDENLNSFNPAGLLLDSKILKEPVNVFSDDSQGKRNHSVIAVGKGIDCKTGEATYILRNSWGPDNCKQYAIQFKNKNQNNPDLTCDENGYIIIKKSQLAKGLKEIVYLKK